jgi:transcriptional regulator with XRE-family HTH domain
MKMDRAYLSEIENGHRKPTVDLLDKLAVALDAQIYELFLPPEPNADPPKSLPSGRPRAKA